MMYKFFNGNNSDDVPVYPVPTPLASKAQRDW